MKKSDAVVLSTGEQLKKFMERALASDSVDIYCDNPELESALSAAGLSFKTLNDLCIPKEQRTEINRWACAAASGWIKICAEKNVFAGADLASALYLRTSYYLASLARSDLYARRVADGRRGLLVFQRGPSRDFPDVSSNYFLNLFLAGLARERGLRLEMLSVPGTARHAQHGFKARLKTAWQKLYGRFVRPMPAQTLVFGSLKHLAPVLSAMKEQGRSAAIYDDLFNFDQFSYARRHGMRYYVPECFPSRTAAGFEERYRRELAEAIEAAAAENLFRHDPKDFLGLIGREIREHGRAFFSALASQSAAYERMRSALSFSSLLLDEDMSPKRAFTAAFFKAKGVNVFCVSHANLAVDFEVPASARTYAQSVTFVNSEFEKDNYVRRGWAPENLVVTGCPRFDRLTASERPVASRDPLRLVYCGASMRSFSDWEPMYLGMHLSNFGVLQRPSLKRLIETARGERAQLAVKSHFPYEAPVWDAFVRAQAPGASVTVSRESSLEGLLRGADAMVLSHWSTALVEAALLGVPVILMDFYACAGAVSYAKEFLKCTVVKDERELRAALQALRNGDPAGIFSRPAPQALEYYLGPRDGCSAARVAAEILKAGKREAAPCLSAV